MGSTVCIEALGLALYRTVGAVVVTVRARAAERAHHRVIAEMDALRRAKEALELSEERLDRTLDDAPIGMTLVGLDGRFLRVNRVLAELVGYPPEELLGMRFQDITHPDDLESDLAQIQRLLRGEIDRYHLGKRYLRKDGSVVDVLLHVSVLRDRAGAPVHFISQIEDVTERKRMERAMREREAALAAERRWLRAVIDRAPVSIVFSVDPEGRRILGNPCAERLFGRSLDDGDGIAQYTGFVCDLEGRPLPVERTPMMRALRGESTTAEELLVRRSDGSTVPVLVNAGPIRDERGRVLGAVSLQADLTRVKELERLREEWTSMVAHDLRQPVSVIHGYAGLLAQSDDASVRARAAHILSCSERLGRMIGDLLDISRLEAHQLKLSRAPSDLAALVRAAVERAAGQTDGHRVQVKVKGALPPVDIDPGRVEQVLGNLLSNAAKYGDAGTDIQVILAPQGGAVQVSVVNRGPGIAPADLPRLFQRFQRGAAAETKIVGVGLGLYISKGLVEAHGGRMWAESTPGEQTRFHFTLPAAAGEVASRGSSGSRARAGSRSPRTGSG